VDFEDDGGHAQSEPFCRLPFLRRFGAGSVSNQRCGAPLATVPDDFRQAMVHYCPCPGPRLGRGWMDRRIGVLLGAAFLAPSGYSPRLGRLGTRSRQHAPVGASAFALFEGRWRSR
jgi:hypothetical protein